MDIALVMICLADRCWEDALDAAAGYGFRYVEPCSGGYLPKVHYDPNELVASRSALERFRLALDSRELRIASLSCCGNPLHPDVERRQRAHEDFVATCKLAEELGVDRVSVVSGCPEGGPGERSVNWVVPSVFDDPIQDVRATYRWQWEERVIPYWRLAAGIAADHGVRLAMEPIASNVVYNPATLDRLRAIIGPTLGALVDPSHMFWQGVDVPSWVRRLGEAVYYAHAKDVSFDEHLVRQDGLASAAPYDDWDSRPWIPRAIGYGHSALYWREFVIALRRAGYDGPIGVELEEPYMTVHDAIERSVALLRSVLPSELAPTGNWFEVYTPAAD